MSESHEEARLATRAFFWRIERRDGVTLGFTSHALADMMRPSLSA